MRATYRWLTRLIALGVVLQAAFVAWGAFEVFRTVNDGRAFTGEPEDYNTGQVLHSVFGVMVIPLLALVLLIVSFFARVPGGVWLALLVLGLVVLQFVLALVSVEASWLGLLHGVNAFVMAGVAGFAGKRAGSNPVRTPEPEGAIAA